VADRFRLHPPHEHYIHGLTEATRRAAARGHTVLVGRGTRHLLGDTPEALHVRLVAPLEVRAERMAVLDNCSADAATARCLQVDRARERFTRYFFGPSALESDQYDLVVNTGRIALDEVVSWAAALIGRDLGGEPFLQSNGRRVLTLSRQLGAGETGFASTLADRLGLRVFDRELLEQEAVRLGVSEAELEKVDEQPAGIFQRFLPGSLQQRYFGALGRLMSDLAAEGDVLLVGRGGSRVLRDLPLAFHVRLLAPLSVRVRRVMEYRWLAEEPARKLIAESDAHRQRFSEDYFGASWSDPLEYHVTVNSGRLGPTAVDLVAFAAERFWQREGDRNEPIDPHRA
jgi:cytidylate kinase